MQLQTCQYYVLADVCEANHLDFQAVMDAIAESDVSFGTNADTFITAAMLSRILGGQTLRLDGQSDDVLISLGS